MRVEMYAIVNTMSGRSLSLSPNRVSAVPGTDAAMTPRPNIPIRSLTTRVFPAATLL